jgi:hypothetical protein
MNESDNVVDLDEVRRRAQQEIAELGRQLEQGDAARPTLRHERIADIWNRVQERSPETLAELDDRLRR